MHAATVRRAHAGPIRRAASLLAGALLIAATGASAVGAQPIEPAITGYSPALTGLFVDPGGPAPGIGKGFLFELAAPIEVTGLSVFQPAVTPPPPPAASAYAVALFTLTPVALDTYAGTLLATAVVGPGSATRAATSGPAGSFLTTALPGALALTVGSLYGVFAAPIEGWIPYYAASGFHAPATASEIVWRGDGGAVLGSGQVVRNDAHSDTGASFEFRAIVPEPSSLVLAGSGLAALGALAVARRRRG